MGDSNKQMPFYSSRSHPSSVMSVSFSSDGRYVASGSKDKTVKIWEIQTNKCLSTLQGHTSSVMSVSFSSDGRYVASGSSRSDREDMGDSNKQMPFYSSRSHI